MILGALGSPGDLCASLGVAAACEVAVFALAFAWSRAAAKICVVDVVWPLSFVAVALGTTAAARARGIGDPVVQGVVVFMVAAWGARLATHLYLRQRGAPEDPRYVSIMRRAAPGHEVAYSVRAVFAPQAALGLVVSLPVTAAVVGGPARTGIAVAGVLVYVVGLGFESVGDAQLAAFLRDPANRGQVLRTGLWAYTRHPNYFGDATVWWGVWLVAASSGYAFLSVLGPIVMTYLLTSVSGRPLLERSLAARKEGWADYVSSTSPFLPRRPRRRA